MILDGFNGSGYPRDINYGPVERLVSLEDGADNCDCEELADKFRVEVLIPFCRRKKFTYMAGNGMTVFYNQKGESINFWDKRLKPVQEIIDLGIFGSNDCLGYYVSDVTKEDIK